MLCTNGMIYQSLNTDLLKNSGRLMIARLGIIAFGTGAEIRRFNQVRVAESDIGTPLVNIRRVHTAGKFLGMEFSMAEGRPIVLAENKLPTAFSLFLQDGVISQPRTYSFVVPKNKKLTKGSFLFWEGRFMKINDIGLRHVEAFGVNRHNSQFYIAGPTTDSQRAVYGFRSENGQMIFNRNLPGWVSSVDAIAVHRDQILVAVRDLGKNHTILTPDHLFGFGTTRMPRSGLDDKNPCFDREGNFVLVNGTTLKSFTEKNFFTPQTEDFNFFSYFAGLAENAKETLPVFASLDASYWTFGKPLGGSV